MCHVRDVQDFDDQYRHSRRAFLRALRALRSYRFSFPNAKSGR